MTVLAVLSAHILSGSVAKVTYCCTDWCVGIPYKLLTNLPSLRVCVYCLTDLCLICDRDCEFWTVIFSHVTLYNNTIVLLLFWNLSGTTRVSRYQKGKTRKGKTNLDSLEQEIVSGSGICWAICKSAPHPREPRQYPTTLFFTGQMPFLPPNQQRRSTEGNDFI